jgi:hypothetical protein
MTEKEPSDVEFTIDPKACLLVGKGKIPDDMLDNLNMMCDDMLVDPCTPSYADRLVGEIHEGSQLEVDIKDKRFKKFKKLLKDASHLYINHFYDSIGKTPIPYHLEVNDVWTVHQYSGDYNPLHDHGSEHFSAFAGFIHTKVPDQIKKIKLDSQRDIYGARGAMDGITSLVWGDVGNRDSVIFKFPQTEFIIPEEGVFYIFPLWLNHVVYPFRGEGERRTISYNINVIWDDDYYDNPTPSKVKIKTSEEERINNG